MKGETLDKLGDMFMLFIYLQYLIDVQFNNYQFISIYWCIFFKKKFYLQVLHFW